MTSETWSIDQLYDWINAVIETTLGGDIWVEGEITNLTRSPKGHVYFQLQQIDPDPGRPRSSLAVTLFEWNRRNVNHQIQRFGTSMRMSDGVCIRIRGSIELYAPRSTVQMKMISIDPAFTVGALASDFQSAVATLHQQGLTEVQKQLLVPARPLKVACITSLGSAAHADFVHEISEASTALNVTMVDARVQGSDAVASLMHALEVCRELPVDLITIVRGGGARTDLVAFDDLDLASAIATMGVPVWTGIGHEIDTTVADVVAHTAHKTPTACAGAIVEHGRRVHDELTALAQRCERATHITLLRAAQQLDTLRERVGHLGLNQLSRQEFKLSEAATSVRRSTTRLDALQSELLQLQARVHAHHPMGVLARGYAIVRDASGALVTRDLPVNSAVHIQTAQSTIDATVTSVTHQPLEDHLESTHYE